MDDLFNLGTENGVTVIITADAGKAVTEAAYRLGSVKDPIAGKLKLIECTYTFDARPKLLKRITRGTMTFIEATQWRESDLARTLHTGTITELEELGRHCTIHKVLNIPFHVPFSSGHLPTYQRELEIGFGPKPDLLAKVRTDAGLLSAS